MSVRNILFFFVIYFCLSCIPLYKSTVKSSVSIKGTFTLCLNNQNSIKFHVVSDSAKKVTLRLFSYSGISLAAIKFDYDTAVVSYAFNNELQNNLEFYLKNYSHKVCLNQLLYTFFFTNFYYKEFEVPVCFGVLHLTNTNNNKSFDFLDLNNQRLFTFIPENFSNISTFPNEGKILFERYCVIIKFDKL